MCSHPDREAAMVEAYPGAWCDPCIATLVKALNEAGIETVASCCGHGKRLGKISLADGRELFILPDFESSRKLDSIPQTLEAVEDFLEKVTEWTGEHPDEKGELLDLLRSMREEAGNAAGR